MSFRLHLSPDRSRHPVAARGAVLICLAIALSLLAGCARYNLGRHAEPPFRSIYIKPASNESFAPQVQTLISQQVREHFIRDGLLQVENEADADAVLEIVLRNYQRNVAATRTDDTAVAEKLRLELMAYCTLVDNRTGKVYFRDRPVAGVAQAFPRDRAQQEEFQAMPILAGDMARRISYEVLQVW
jgi:hypothetical protein